jgi:hypothetical protein
MVRRVLALLVFIGVAHLVVGSTVEACLAKAPSQVAGHCGHQAPLSSHHAPSSSSHQHLGDVCCQLGAACVPWALISSVDYSEIGLHRLPVGNIATTIFGLASAPDTPPPRA